MKIKYILCIAVLAIILSCEKNNIHEENPVTLGYIEVVGDLIDIRPFSSGQEVYPQNVKYCFGDDVDTIFDNDMNYAVSLIEYSGPEKVRRGDDGLITIASEFEDLLQYGWESENISFSTNGIIYYIHTRYVKANEWIKIPKLEEQQFSTMVIAENIYVGNTDVPGTIIASVPELRSTTINNVTIAILSDGTYVTACTGADNNLPVTIYKSKDKGKSWSRIENSNIASNGIVNYFNLFVHNGSLYMMGTGKNGENFKISKSDDDGITWTIVETEQTGLLLKGEYHSSSVPIVIHNNRIWRAVEKIESNIKKPFVMSADINSDLLDANSWVSTNTVEITTDLVLDDNVLTELIEGNIVVTPKGELVNILRASSKTTSNAVVKIPILDQNTLIYPTDYHITKFSGGGKKFTIRYDETSKLYWTLSNPAASAGMTHDGFYSGGITYDLMRNRLVLSYSKDLNTWIPFKTIFSNKDPFFHGYQYADWLIDGKDIILVIRLASPESRGLPTRQHDANFMSFFRITNFSTL